MFLQNPFESITNNQNSPTINKNQFIQGIKQLDQNTLNQLVARARMTGIPDSYIKAGLSFIDNLRKSN